MGPGGSRLGLHLSHARVQDEFHNVLYLQLRNSLLGEGEVHEVSVRAEKRLSSIISQSNVWTPYYCPVLEKASGQSGVRLSWIRRQLSLGILPA